MALCWGSGVECIRNQDSKRKTFAIESPPITTTPSGQYYKAITTMIKIRTF